jgi:hypothetical protein
MTDAGHHPPMVAPLVPYPDLHWHVSGPFVAQCLSAPNGIHVRLVVGNTGDEDVADLRIEATDRDGNPHTLIPGRTADGGDCDLARLPAGGTVWMNISPGEGASTESVFDLAFHVGGEVRFRMQRISVEDPERL